MYATQQLETYRTVHKTTASGRELEASVLSQAASKLRNCQDRWDADDRELMLDEALKYNQKIWSIFQSELAKEDNLLPKKLRVDLLALSAFMDRRSFEVMASPTPEKLNIMININMNIAAGLRASPA